MTDKELKDIYQALPSALQEEVKGRVKKGIPLKIAILSAQQRDTKEKTPAPEWME